MHKSSRVLSSSHLACYILTLTTLIAVSLGVTKFCFLYRPFALKRGEPRCYEHLAWVMSLPPSQFVFVTLVSSVFLEILADKQRPQKTQRIPLLLSERDSLLFNVFGGEGGRGPVVLAAVCGIKWKG